MIIEQYPQKQKTKQKLQEGEDDEDMDTNADLRNRLPTAPSTGQGRRNFE